jgi:hypothetical protein
MGKYQVKEMAKKALSALSMRKPTDDVQNTTMLTSDHFERPLQLKYSTKSTIKQIFVKLR